MGLLELGIVAAFVVIAAYCIYIVFFSGKKKKKEKQEKSKNKKEKIGKKEKQEKKENLEKKSKTKKDEEGLISKSLGEKKIEPAIKKEGAETQKKEELEEEKELVLQKQPPKSKGEPFRIIRKQSKVKINKQALKSGSRNPSVTKVFDKGVRIDIPEGSNGGLVDDAGQEIAKVIKEVDAESNSAMSDMISQEIGHYGVREPHFDVVSGEHEFKMNAPIGSPNRAPTIGDRTNFASHLNISEDNNLSGVMGTGVAKIIERTEAQSEQIDRNTEKMVRNIKRDILGDMPKLGGMFDYPSIPSSQQQKQSSAQQKLKNIDAETLIIADAIRKRKGK